MREVKMERERERKRGQPQSFYNLTPAAACLSLLYSVIRREPPGSAHTQGREVPIWETGTSASCVGGYLSHNPFPTERTKST